MQLIEVTNQKLAKEFLRMAVKIYANDPHWIRPLDKDIEDVFDPKKNKFFRFGEAIRFILRDQNGQSIGRIAAFTNKKYKNKGDDAPTGGIGFFECINDQHAANCLFDHAKQWLQTKGMEAMDGPINFGERDRWWGLVTEGYQEPLYAMNYNPPYYTSLFENYGFQVFFNQICFGLDPQAPLSNKIKERHHYYEMQPEFHCRHFSKDKLSAFAQDFVTVYNKAWAGHGGLKEMPLEQAMLLFKKMLPVMDEKIVWFAYHHDEPIAIFISLPDLNQLFKYLHGKFGILHKIYFLLLKKIIRNKKFNGIIFGVVPEWQGKGIDAYIIGESAKKYLQTPACKYESFEMQWIGDFNPKMLNVAQGLGPTYQSRKLVTFRYLFDRQKEFKRHPPI